MCWQSDRSNPDCIYREGGSSLGLRPGTSREQAAAEEEELGEVRRGVTYLVVERLALLGWSLTSLRVETLD